MGTIGFIGITEKNNIKKFGTLNINNMKKTIILITVLFGFLQAGYAQDEDQQIYDVVSKFCETMKEVSPMEGNKPEVIPLINFRAYNNDTTLKVNVYLISGYEIIYAKRTLVIVKTWNNTGVMEWENILTFLVTPNTYRGQDCYQIDPSEKRGNYIIPWDRVYVTQPPKKK